MQDLKHYGLRRGQDRLDAAATAVAWLVALALAVLYLLPLVPA